MNAIKKYIGIFILIAIVFGSGFYYVSNIYGYKTYLIKIEDNEEVLRVSSRSDVVRDILNENNIEYKESDTIKPALDVKVAELEVISVISSKKILFKNGNDEKEIVTNASKVSDFIKEQDVKLSKNDIINVDLRADLKDGMTIKIDYVTFEKEVDYADISFEKIEKESDELESGKTTTKVAGQVGVLETKKTKKYVNNVLVNTYLVSRGRVKEPVNEIVIIGTGEKKNLLDTEEKKEDKKEQKPVKKQEKKEKQKKQKKTNTKPKKESNGKYIIMEATAYNLKGRTASGVMSGFGKVAVDPRVIPLGTKLRIESTDSWPSYGYAVAADTGSAIKGNRIDLFYSSRAKCLEFGRRKVRVYIIK